MLYEQLKTEYRAGKFLVNILTNFISIFNIHRSVHRNIGCPTTCQSGHFFNNSKTNDDIATKQTHATDTFLFISHTTNVLLFKSRCNIFIGFRIIKEMPGLVSSGTFCIFLWYKQQDAPVISNYLFL
jgi:hypothetical protein